ncbi:MAG: hypothetical protein H6747_04585 [Deltaproteobacteria bacterium]|nr:hypothetical protein [Deltaproteobacteria bacterium]
MNLNMNFVTARCVAALVVLQFGCADAPSNTGGGQDSGAADATASDAAFADVFPDGAVDRIDALDAAESDAALDAGGGDTALDGETDVAADADNDVTNDAATDVGADVGEDIGQDSDATAADADVEPGDTAGGDDGTGGTDSVGGGCPGAVGCSCKLDGECSGGGACVVWSSGVKQCAQPCKQDGDCGAGEICAGEAGSAVCMPNGIALCAPCLGNAECAIAAPGGSCVDGGAAGAFCGIACTSDADCPAKGASVCAEVKDIAGQATKQCVPPKGETCACSDYAIGTFAKTVCFVDGQPGCSATRQCLPAGATGAPAGGGLSSCAPQAASDESCDGLDNDCDGETDEGGAALCEDDNVCTADACTGGPGCSHAPAAGPCSDGDACTDKDACDGGACKGSSVVCDDGDVCTADSCDPAKGCQIAPISATDTVLAPCDDNNACTGDDSCAAGKCVGTKVTCDDANPCTDDACDLAAGCTATANSGKCSDGSACTTGDGCVAGVCTGAKVDCEDNNVCTADSCDPAKGCQHLFVKGDCDDGNACTDADACVNGDCVGKLPDQYKGCDDDNPCTDVACDLATGCTLVDNTKPCDDGDACTGKDACKGGSCAGQALGCDDDNPCTSDSCDKGVGCVNAPTTAPCDDGDACTELDVCKGGNCAGKAKVCDDDNACTTDACSGGVCLAKAATGSACDDGTACTSGDLCDGDGDCAGKPISCDDGNPCTDDACDPKLGCAAKKPNTASCDDGNACTKADACDGKGACKGTPIVTADADACDDGNACTTDGCDSEKGCFHKNNTLPCSDGDSCTGGAAGDVCKDGKCAPGAQVCKCKVDGDCDAQNPNPCLGAQICTAGQCALKPGTAVTCADDGDSCSLEACDPKTGTCVTTPAKDGIGCDKDGSVCTENDACSSGACTAGKTMACDDGNPCTADSCNKLIGCVHLAQAATCTDGDACTEKDTCVNGKCAPGSKLDCDDANACTKDSCDPKAVDNASACTHTALDGSPCDDGNPCTESDACAKGACAAGGAKNCDDSNPCTSDSCGVGGKCSNLGVPDGAACDDGVPCFVADSCIGGSCKPGKVAKCDDGQPCTADLCDAKTGACSHAPATDGTACVDATPCTAAACTGGKCIATGPKVCDDGDACTSAETCDKATDTCKAGAVETCDDGLPCTTDSCDSKSGACSHVAKQPCTIACKTAADCASGDLCTTPSCSAQGACVFTPSHTGQLCGDGRICDDKGACAPTTAGWATQIASSPAAAFFCARTWNGRVACWGDNSRKQIGQDSGKSTHMQPSYLAAPANIRVVRVGATHACAVDTNGAVWCWGDNTYRESNPASAVATTGKPTQVKDLPATRDLALGDGFTCALLTDDTVRCWGKGNDYATGLNTTATTSAPKALPGLTGVRAIMARNRHVCVVRSDESLWCWGLNSQRQSSSIEASFTKVPTEHPAPIANLRTIGGTLNSTCMANGSAVQCFGSLASGNGGTGDKPATSATPKTAKLAADVVGLSGGAGTQSFLTRDGKLWMAGLNANGEFGDGGTTQQLSPVASGFAPVVIDAALGASAACVVALNGQVYCSGDGTSGELGIGQFAKVTSPIKALGFCTSDTMCDDGNTCTNETCDTGTGLCASTALTGGSCEDGDACTGAGSCAAGACKGGAAKTCNDNDPCTVDGCNAVTGCTTAPAADGVTCDDGNPCTAVDGCKAGSCVGLKDKDCSDGKACTLDSCNKQDGSCVSTFDPTCTAPCATAADCADGDDCTVDACVVATGKCTHDAAADGVVCAGGQCASGVCAAPSVGWAKQLEANRQSYVYCAIDQAGEIYCWGLCGSNKLCGVDYIYALSAPTKVVGISGATDLTVGPTHSCAQTTGGKVYCWGSNAAWQMGDLGKAAGVESLPIEVPELAGMTALTALTNATCGIASGKVRCIGTNDRVFADAQAHKTATEITLSEPVTDLVGTDMNLCAQGKSRRWICWGDNASRALLDSASGAIAAASFGSELIGGRVAVQAGNLCWTANGKGACRGSNNGGQLGVAGAPSGFSFASMPTGVNVAAARLGPDTAFAITEGGLLYAAGADASYQLGIPPPANGKVETWTRVPLLDKVVDAKASLHGTCILTNKGMILCVGKNDTSPQGPTGASVIKVFSVVQSPCQKDADCSDSSPCTAEVCGSGVCKASFASGSCDDGNPCSGPDLCQVGVCKGAADDTGKCDDGKLCTTDTCSGGSCLSVATVCDDGDSCTQQDTCVVVGGKESCSGTAAPGACDDGNPCTTDSCDKATGVCKSTIDATCATTCSSDADCDDDNSCTADTCSGGSCSYAVADEGKICRVGHFCSAGTCRAPSSGWARAVAITDSSVCVVARDQRVFCWGQLLSGTLLKPQPVAGLSSVVALTSAASSPSYCATRSDGQVLCWGKNQYGELGTGDKNPVTTPSSNPYLAGAKLVALNRRASCVYKSGNSVLCVGVGSSGQLGDGTSKTSLTPVEAKLSWPPVRLLTGGDRFCAVSANNDVACWGSNSGGVLVEGSANVTAPTVVESVEHPDRLWIGGGTRVWVGDDSVAYGRGYDYYGSLGLGTLYSSASVPTTKLPDITVLRHYAQNQQSSSTTISLALDKDGVMWAAGYGNYGTLGNGTTTDTAKRVKSLLAPKAVDVSVGNLLACAVTTGGSVYCTGGGYHGNGTDWASSTGWVQVTEPCLSDTQCSDGEVCTTDTCNPSTLTCAHTKLSGGACEDGKLCTADDACDNGVCVGGAIAPCDDGDACTTGDACIETDGKAGCAGTANTWCDDGKPCTIDSCDPKDGGCVFQPTSDCAVGCASNDDCFDDSNPCTEGVCNLISGKCTQATLPDDSPCGVRAVCTSGTCGAVASNLPRAVAVAGMTSCAVKGDGTVKCWGESNAYQAGYNGVFVTSAYAVQGAANAVDVQMANRASCMVDSNADLYCWGLPQYGATLGYGGFVAAKLPAVDKIKKLQAGYEGFCALRTDGSVLCWGRGDAGQMGDGTTNTSNATPHTVKNLPNDVVDLSGNGNTFCAHTSKAEVLCWGSGTYCNINANCVSINALPVKVTTPPTAKVLWAGDYGMMTPGRGSQLFFRGTSLFGGGAIGTTATTKVLAPTSTLGLTARPLDVISGAATLVLTPKGVFGAGYNQTAALAMDSYGSDLPIFAASVQINKFKPIAMATNGGHSCFICLDSQIRCLGANSKGQVGAGYVNAVENGLRVVSWF